MSSPIARCAWVRSAPLFYITYHDTEWARVAPAPSIGDGKAKPGTTAAADALLRYRRDGHYLFELLCLEGQQCGLSWVTVLRKRGAYRAAFLDFNPQSILQQDQSKTYWTTAVEKLIANKPQTPSSSSSSSSAKKRAGARAPANAPVPESVVRHRGKLLAIVTNARAYKRLTNALAARIREGLGEARPQPPQQQQQEEEQKGGKGMTGKANGLLQWYPSLGTLATGLSAADASRLFADFLWDFSYRDVANGTGGARGKGKTKVPALPPVDIRRVFQAAFALRTKTGAAKQKKGTAEDVTFPTTNPNAEALSAMLKKSGFAFVGPTTLYAFFQASGMVNDHMTNCACLDPCEQARRDLFAQFDEKMGGLTDRERGVLLDAFRDEKKLIQALKAEEAREQGRSAGSEGGASRKRSRSAASNP